MTATCAYCDAVATDREHVWPRSRGGTDHPNNIVAACKRCNNVKASRSLLDESCEGCGAVRTPGDVDSATGVAFYACRCGESWQTYWNLRLVPMLVGAVP